MKKYNTDGLTPWLTLLHADKLGPTKAKTLLSHYGAAQRILNASTSELTSFGLNNKTISAIKNPITENFQLDLDWLNGDNHHIIPYDDEDEAIRIANDTPYGLSGYVSSTNIDHARSIAARLHTGMVHINNASCDTQAPFGGYKQSGNGREWGPHGIEEFLEIKSVYGYRESQ